MLGHTPAGPVAQIVTPPPQPPPGKVSQAAGTLWMVLAVSALVVLFVLGVAAVTLIRRRRHLAALKADTARRRHADAWAHAGDRAETPTVEALEDLYTRGPRRDE